MMRLKPQTLFSNNKPHCRRSPPTSYPIRRPVPHTRRPMMTSSSLPPSPSTQPLFSANADIPTLTASLSTLLSPTGRWHLTAQRTGLERTFKFKTFKKTWDFMTVVAAECKARNHHPAWSNVYNTAYVCWTTHAPRGLSGKDVEMARFCDEQAAVYGEEVVPESRGGGGKAAAAALNEGGEDAVLVVGRELVERVAGEGGAECCVPKGRANAKA